MLVVFSFSPDNFHQCSNRKTHEVFVGSLLNGIKHKLRSCRRVDAVVPRIYIGNVNVKQSKRSEMETVQYYYQALQINLFIHLSDGYSMFFLFSVLQNYFKNYSVISLNLSESYINPKFFHFSLFRGM